MPAEPASAAPVPHAHADAWLDSRQAPAYAKVSLKTLLRANGRGEEVGLRKVLRKLVFNRELLDHRLLAQKATN